MWQGLGGAAEARGPVGVGHGVVGAVGCGKGPRAVKATTLRLPWRRLWCRRRWGGQRSLRRALARWWRLTFKKEVDFFFVPVLVVGFRGNNKENKFQNTKKTKMGSTSPGTKKVCLKVRFGFLVFFVGLPSLFSFFLLGNLG